ncbi:uncharacterized protein PG986_013728 [Apiospora aurea]|uniref:Uncharacterized protein n=1 Tax=Apiospora aurea TaxID=335848 RepID=A0ABR1PWC9_9PEZI
MAITTATTATLSGITTAITTAAASSTAATFSTAALTAATSTAAAAFTTVAFTTALTAVAASMVAAGLAGTATLATFAVLCNTLHVSKQTEPRNDQSSRLAVLNDSTLILNSSILVSSLNETAAAVAILAWSDGLVAILDQGVIVRGRHGESLGVDRQEKRGEEELVHLGW